VQAASSSSSSSSHGPEHVKAHVLILSVLEGVLDADAVCVAGVA